MEDNKEIESVCDLISNNYECFAPNVDIQLQKRISDRLDSCGFMYRIFARKKKMESIKLKMHNKLVQKYIPNSEKMQDLVGVRITLYFRDDIDICINALNSLFDFVGCEHDVQDEQTFKPQRINYVYRIPRDIYSVPDNLSDKCYIDNTFEVQFRTVFSEGWHEVEHDIRYKYKSFWSGENKLYREMNGLLAVLETVDNDMIRVCSQLAYNSYKKKSWEAMIRNTFRIHISGEVLSPNIWEILDSSQFSKVIYRFDREELILAIMRTQIPITCNNIVFIINELVEEKNDLISSMTPDLIKRRIAGISER